MTEYPWEDRLAVAERVRVFNWMSTSALVVWLLEYFHTFELEIAFAWPSPWNAIKVLYFGNRYLVLIPVALCIYSHRIVEVNQCYANFLAASMCIIVCVGTSETLLFIRVWALADRDKRLMIFLFSFLSAALAASTACYILFFISMEYAPSPAPSIAGCVLMRSRSTMLITVFSLVLFEQTMIMTMCLYVSKRRNLGTKSPLIRTFFVDGGIYFTVLTLISLANLIALVGVDTNGYQFVLAAHQAVLHSTLTNRMFLNLRQLAAQDQGVATDLVTRELELLNNIKTTIQQWEPARPEAATSENELSRIYSRQAQSDLELHSRGTQRH